LAWSTQKEYLRCCVHFVRHHVRSPRELGETAIKEYPAHLQFKGAGPETVKMNFADGRPRAWRDFPKLLALMRALAFLHQHQREVKEARTALGEVVRYVEPLGEALGEA
jgi:hypothetical protein